MTVDDGMSQGLGLSPQDPEMLVAIRTDKKETHSRFTQVEACGGGQDLVVRARSAVWPRPALHSSDSGRLMVLLCNRLGGGQRQRPAEHFVRLRVGGEREERDRI